MAAQDVEAANGGLDGVVRRAVSWLRAGYPDGVPKQDYVALLGVLRRSLTDTELDNVVNGLLEDANADQTLLNKGLIEARIADVLKGPILDEDVVRVSTRLAAAGWPLAALHPEPQAGHDVAPPRLNLIERAVGWLRGGYPSGLPDHDYIALLALLRRRLTDAEVIQVGHQLIRDGVLSPDRADIGASILRLTSEMPSDQDIERVRSYLTEHGWPPELGF